MVWVAPGVLSTTELERNQGLTSSSPVLAVLRLSVFGPDSKVLVALAVASRGVGENAARRLQVVVRSNQAGTRWTSEFSSFHTAMQCCGSSAQGHWCSGQLHGPHRPPHLECSLMFALALLAASDLASLVGVCL